METLLVINGPFTIAAFNLKAPDHAHDYPKDCNEQYALQ
jgi:hypothetical protein